MTAYCTGSEKGDLRSFPDLKDRFALRNQDLFRYLELREYCNKKGGGARRKESSGRIYGLCISSKNIEDYF